LTKAADAIGLAALRAPRPQPQAPKGRDGATRAPRRRRRRLKLRFGRMMFAGVVIYLIGAGAIGELQLLHVQSAEHAVYQQLIQTNAQNAALQRRLTFLHSTAGETQAVRSELHYAPSGSTSLAVHNAP
jgi:hypothetical protein